MKPLVIRIDEVGRAEAVELRRHALPAPAARTALFPDAVHREALQPNPGHCAARISRFAALPRPGLADATIAQNDQSRTLEGFLTNSSADEVDVVVQNVSLSELTSAPFKASISFQKVFYAPGTRHERTRETHVAQVDFVLRSHVPNTFVRVNPLGLQIAYFRVDQAFEEQSR